MRISRDLSLVVPVTDGTVETEVDGQKVVEDNIVAYVYAMPVSQEVFEVHYRVLAKTFNDIYSGGLSITAGPRVAALLLKDIAVSMGRWEGPGGVEQGLMQEIRRLASVVVPGPAGWDTVTFQEAVQKSILSTDDVSEVENALTFFTVASRMHLRAERATVLNGAANLWGAQISSLSFTEFLNSLQTSTRAASTGARADQ